MKIVVSAEGGTLDAPTSPVFGRCAFFVVVDNESMEAQALPNPAASQSGGAGIQAAQLVASQGAGAVLTGNLGPNAFDVLRAAGVLAYHVPGGNVRQAVRAFQAGALQPLGGPSVQAHAGMGGRGQGMGRGIPAGSGVGAAPPTSSQASQRADLAELKQSLEHLRQQMANVVDKIDALERER